MKRTRRGPGEVGVAKGREGQGQVCADLGVGDPDERTAWACGTERPFVGEKCCLLPLG